MDIGAFKTAHDDPSVITIIDLNGDNMIASDGNPITVSVLGKDSPTYKRELHNRQNKVLNDKSKRRSVDIGDAEAMMMEAVAGCVKGWHGFKEGDADLPCTYENVLRVFQSIPEVYEQVEAFMSNRANFMKRP